MGKAPEGARGSVNRGTGSVHFDGMYLLVLVTHMRRGEYVVLTRLLTYRSVASHASSEEVRAHRMSMRVTVNVATLRL